jgi:hypothetical protein
MRHTQLLTLAAALVTAALFTAVAHAGEAKNQSPFTRIVASAPSVSIAGEPKNMAPFTNRVARRQVVPDWFERYAAAHPYGRDVVASAPTSASVGFRWRDALLGAAAATAACILLVGLGFSRTRRRSQMAHPAGT